jgi:hypothetical protein
MSRPVDPFLAESLGHLLLSRHLGAENAATWDVLRVELEAFGTWVGHVRRLQECAETLLDGGVAVVGLSSSGVFVARTVDELDRAIEESERRARKTLTKRRRLRRARLTMLGQQPIPEAA